MKKIKKIAIFSAVGLLSASFVGCSKDHTLYDVNVDLSQIEDINFSDDQAISTTLEENLGISISEEAAEFLDSDSVIKALQGNDMNQSECQQLVDNSYLYFSLRAKEDNPEYVDKNLHVSYASTPAVIGFDNKDYNCDSIVNEYLMNMHSLQQSIDLDTNDMFLRAEDVAKEMILFSAIDIEAKSPFLGNGEVFVKTKK